MRQRTVAATKHGTIVSWTRFCEWVQGKTVETELDGEHWTTVTFTDLTCVRFYSGTDVKFGEKTIEPPMVEIEEAP